MREVEVVPGEEIILFPFEGRSAKIRMVVYPLRNLLTAPGLHEISHMEFEQYLAGLKRAQDLLRWHHSSRGQQTLGSFQSNS